MLWFTLIKWLGISFFNLHVDWFSKVPPFSIWAGMHSREGLHKWTAKTRGSGLNGNNLSGKGPLCRQGAGKLGFQDLHFRHCWSISMFLFSCPWLDTSRRPKPWAPSVRFKGGNVFSPPAGWVVAGGNCHWKVRGTLNLLSSNLNVGGNTEAHWSASNKAAPCLHSEGERGYFAPWQQVTSIWNCQQTLIDLPKCTGCDVRGSAAWRESWAFSGIGAALARCQLTWLIGND